MTTDRQNVAEEAIGLAELLQTLKRAKWLILAFALVSAVAAGLVRWSIPDTYEASVSLSPVSSSPSLAQSGGAGALASPFDGLAALAGISVTGESRKWESLEVLQSEALTEAYIEDHHLLPVLYEKLWDAGKKRWKETDPSKIPTLWKANRVFESRVRRISIDARSGLVTLTIRWKDPKVAAKWANDLVKVANDSLRRRAIEESERNIAYLNQEVAKTEMVEAKQAIYAILQAEINKSMLARGSEEYAFKILDPAVPPEKPSSLPWWLWSLMALAGSIVLSILVALARPRPRRNRGIPRPGATDETAFVARRMGVPRSERRS